MSQRKLIRPGAEVKRDGTRAVRRKQSPPEQTNAEEFYYLKQMAAKTAMVVVLNNGEQLNGWIEWYDKGAIKLNRHGDPNLLIPKANILYMFKEEELKKRGGGRRRPAAITVSRRVDSIARDHGDDEERLAAEDLAPEGEDDSLAQSEDDE